MLPNKSLGHDSSHGRPVAVVFDLDCTITDRDTYRSFLMGILRRHPMRLLRLRWLPIAMGLYGLKLRDNGWLKKAFLGAIVGGATRREVELWVEQFLSELLQGGIRPGALAAIREHRDSGHHLIMATASFDFYAEELGKRLGFDAIISTRSVWAEGRLKGELAGGNCFGPVKAERLKCYFGGQREQWYIVGYSDHHSDLPMMEWVDRAVAINPQPLLAKIAASRGS